ncbi:MAG: GrpB family protein [Chitinispirillaceae bacterium]
MPKTLAEMTNEELWKLFPIIISDHDPEWKNRYPEEKKRIEKVIGCHNLCRINHIGSTAVPGLLSKPTIDILLEIEDETDIPHLISQMEATGYLHSPQPENAPPHLMFLKGYTPEGFRGQVFHVHVRYCGDWDELYFRDYLRTHAETADEYGKLKLELRREFEHDRDGYTHAKTDFIKKTTLAARRELGEKYKPR